MAIVQISRIQVRRGLQQDLPQLASGEMGWSTDERRLFIGNGVTDAPDYAPTEGVTEVLTEYSDFLGFISSYVFQGTESGYTSQTGATSLTPITRNIQSVLDDVITVKDFGVNGDGIIDDTIALNRAIQEIYKNTLNGVHVNVQRTIKIPAGTYRVTGQILIPPNCTLVGDGKNNTVITSTNSTTFATCDSFFQSGVSLGSGDALMPTSISISNLSLVAPAGYHCVLIDTATDIIFNQVKFSGGDYSLNIIGESADIRVIESDLVDYVYGPFDISTNVTGLVTRTNYFNTARLQLLTGTTTITTLTSGAGVMEYQISDNADNYRIGMLKYNMTADTLSFDDEYTEPATTLDANLFASHSGTLTCETSSDLTLKYNIKQFI